MAYSGHLNLTVSIKDSRTRETGPPPILQGWTPALVESRKLTLLSEEWTEVLVPDGATSMHFDLTGQVGIRFNWEEGAAATDGFPITPTTNPNSLPYFSGVGDDPTCWLYNETDDDVELMAYWY